MTILATIFAGAGATLLAAALAWVARELVSLRVEVAIVRDQLMPAGAPSLREIVDGHGRTLARHAALLEQTT